MILHDIWAWLVTSSADPTRYSMLLKGALVLIAPKILAALTAACGFGLVCLGVDAGWFNDTIDFIAKAAEILLYLVGAGMTLYGMGRKIYLARWSHPDATVGPYSEIDPTD